MSLQPVAGGIAPWRVPYPEHDLYLPGGGVGRAAMPAGVRLTLRTDSPWLALDYVAAAPPLFPVEPETARLDVRCDGRLVATHDLDVGGAPARLRVPDLPAGDRTVELWLPHFSQLTVLGVDVAPGARVGRDRRRQRRWVHYGSSISQGRGAVSPSRIWPATVARRAGLDLTLTAMGAGCHLQPMFARFMRDLPADLITLCVGVNPHFTGSLNEDSFQANLIGFVRILRERHPSTPVVVVSTIHAPKRESSPGPAGMTLADYRRHAGEAVGRLRRHGDDRVAYADGLDLFGPADAHLMLEPPHGDPVHLAPAGHDLLATRFQGLLQAADLLR